MILHAHVWCMAHLSHCCTKGERIRVWRAGIPVICKALGASSAPLIYFGRAGTTAPPMRFTPLRPELVNSLRQDRGTLDGLFNSSCTVSRFADAHRLTAKAGKTCCHSATREASSLNNMGVRMSPQDEPHFVEAGSMFFFCSSFAASLAAPASLSLRGVSMYLWKQAQCISFCSSFAASLAAPASLSLRGVSMYFRASQ